MYLVKNLYEENISIKDLVNFLDNNKLVTRYYLIKHDKDKMSNGEYKKSHYHLLIESDNTSHHLKNDLQTSFKVLYSNISQCSIETCRSAKSQLRYLIHKDNLEKAQYDVTDVISNDIENYYEMIQDQEKRTEADIMLDLFYDYVVEKVENDKKLPEDFDVLMWFKVRGHLSYYIKNKNNLNQMIRTIALALNAKPF